MPPKTYKDISFVLRNIVNEYHLDVDLSSQKIISNWETLVGKKIAKLCTPVSLNKDELTVKAVNNVWKQELALLHEDLVNLLNDRLNMPQVKKIKIV
ncbi:MAG: DUF721 domain-containing protein [Calditrichales bacterium]|nr:MAG: DUF721 domain-containing protein [Calditrichales bacterium]